MRESGAPERTRTLTLGLEGRCSIQLSYGRLATIWYEPPVSREPMRAEEKVVGAERFEPRHPAPKAGALPDCAIPRRFAEAAL